MGQSSWLSALSSGERADLEARIDDYFRQWNAGRPFSPASFLPSGSPRYRAVVAVELIVTDMELRAKNGQRVLVENYLRSVKDDLTFALPGLLAEEYLVRSRYDRPPEFEEYRYRYPASFTQAVAEIRTRVRASGMRGPRAGTRADEQRVTGDPKLGDRGLGYQLGRAIGKGAFGEVYEAEAPGGVRVAVKRTFRSLDHPATRAELDALDALRTLSHPFLLQPHAYWTQDRQLHVAMELADGSLEGEIVTSLNNGVQGVPTGKLITFLEQAAAALDFLHSHGITHRDVKPSNLLLQHGYAKVADFGLARRQMAAVVGGQDPIGTPLFMAPEVWFGRVGFASDQYSLAATYVLARQGQQYLRWISGQDTDGGIPDVIRLLVRFPKSERQVLERALAGELADRYPSCTEFVKALQACLTTPDWVGRAAAKVRILFGGNQHH